MEVYADANIVQWAKETLENDIKMMALAVGLPDHVVDKIETKHTGFLEAEVQNNYEVKGVPIGEYLDHGTRAHMIYGNPILAWTDGLGFSHFARYVAHPGFEGYHYMDRGAQTGMPSFKKLVEKKLADMSNCYVVYP